MAPAPAGAEMLTCLLPDAFLTPLSWETDAVSPFARMRTKTP